MVGLTKSSGETTEDKAKRLANAAPFDVHKWSAYPEVKAATDALYDVVKAKLPKRVQERAQKRNLQVLLLDIYAKYVTDPTMYVGVHMGKTPYQTKALPKRYNKLHISPVTPNLVHILDDLSFIEFEPGHYGRTGGSSHVTRIRASEKLINTIINKHGLEPRMIERTPNTECIILRDYDDVKKRQVEVDYDDNPETVKMRTALWSYNNLLRVSFIDVPEAPSDGIPTRSDDKSKRVRVSQYEKFVRRIFNNNSFEQGGRYYGGWWQRIPKEWREKITIGTTEVTEIDYSGLHIILLYAMEGIDYWKTDGKDPYSIPGWKKSEKLRVLLKQVLLAAINAKDAKSALKGVHWRINSDPSGEFAWVKGGSIDLDKLIKEFSDRHKPIKKYFFSGIGTKLQRLDSEIASEVINQFTQQDIPVLCIHDSFVVPTPVSEKLVKLMEQAIKDICAKKDFKKPLSVLKSIGVEPGWWNVMRSDPAWFDIKTDYLKHKYNQTEQKKKWKKFKKLNLQKDFYKEELT